MVMITLHQMQQQTHLMNALNPNHVAVDASKGSYPHQASRSE